MSFTEAVRSVLSQYATFHGRARRSEYWWFFLFYIIVLFVASIIDGIFGTNWGDSFYSNWGLFYSLAVLGLLLPNLGVLFRRLHDTNHSGWWVLIGLIPLVGWIVLLVFCVTDSDPGPNQYGPSPKAAGAMPEYGTPGSGFAQPQG